jgi:molybdate-binding protein/DNA-binding XRE family transcriptional regulator
MDHLHNRLVELRQKLGLKQQELAERAGITRQSLSSLETGRSVPSTPLALRLARALGCRVEDLFSLEAEASSLTAEIALPEEPPAEGGPRSARASPGHPAASPGQRVAVVAVGRRWVAHPLAPDAPASTMVAADGVLSERCARPAAAGGPALAKVRLLRDREALKDSLLCVGCAPPLGILTARAASQAPGERVLWLERSSSAALDMLRRGHAHVAGAHLLDEGTGEFNVPFVRRLLPDRAMLVVTLARWEAGLLVAPGNPRRLKGIADLARPGVALVPREPGAGAQKLLERKLQRAGVPLNAVGTRGPVAHGHMDVARAVAMGVADAGVAIRSAALAHGLDFVPLAEERFDLVLPKDLSGDPRIVRLLDTLGSRPFRRELESLGGYAAREAGTLVASTGATA